MIVKEQIDRIETIFIKPIIKQLKDEFKSEGIIQPEAASKLSALLEATLKVGEQAREFPLSVKQNNNRYKDNTAEDIELKDRIIAIIGNDDKEKLDFAYKTLFRLRHQYLLNKPYYEPVSVRQPNGEIAQFDTERSLSKTLKVQGHHQALYKEPTSEEIEQVVSTYLQAQIARFDQIAKEEYDQTLERMLEKETKIEGKTKLAKRLRDAQGEEQQQRAKRLKLANESNQKFTHALANRDQFALLEILTQEGNINQTNLNKALDLVLKVHLATSSESVNGNIWYDLFNAILKSNINIDLVAHNNVIRELYRRKSNFLLPLLSYYYKIDFTSIEPAELLIEAAKAGNFEAMKSLSYLLNIPFNSKTNNNETVLSVAVDNNDVELFEKIINADEIFINGILPVGNLVSEVIFKAIEQQNKELPKFLELYFQKYKSFYSNNSNKCLLHIAAKHNDIRSFKYIYENSGAKPKYKQLIEVDGNGQTPLHVAAIYGSDRIIEEYLDNKFLKSSQVNSKDCKGYTPIHLSIKYGNLAIYNLLKKRWGLEGFLLNTENYEGESLLHTAIINGYKQIVDDLLMDDGVKITNFKEDNILHLAIKHKRHEVVKLLLDVYGFKEHINKPNGDGITPLELAIINNDVAMVSLLLKNGARQDLISAKTGETILHLAAKNASVEILNLLDIEKLINVKDRFSGATALHAAIINGNYQAAKFLIQKDKNIINIADSSGFTPLHWAVTLKKRKMVDLLLNDAELNYLSNDLNTPLHTAIAIDDTEVAKKLIEKGASLNVENLLGDNPFTFAVKQKNIELAKFMLEHIIKTNSQSKLPIIPSGTSLLHMAAGLGDQEVIDIILKHYSLRVDINGTDTAGNTPVVIAIKNNNIQIANHFLNIGANPTIINNEGESALRLYAAYGFKDLVTGLLSDQKATISEEEKINLAYVALANNQEETAIEIFKHIKKIGHEKLPNNSTFLHMALKGEHYKLAEFLVDRGAKITKRDIDGHTPLYYCKDKEVEEKLILAAKKFNKVFNLLEKTSLKLDNIFTMWTYDIIEAMFVTDLKDSHSFKVLTDSLINDLKLPLTEETRVFMKDKIKQIFEYKRTHTQDDAKSLTLNESSTQELLVEKAQEVLNYKTSTNIQSQDNSNLKHMVR